MRRPSERWSTRLQRSWSSRDLLARSLLPLALLFGTVTAVRRALYRLGWLAVDTLPVPVVVVGNLVAGGAGKTPTVMAVVTLLRRHGFTPGIISRGHGRHGAGVLQVQPSTPVAACGDEPLLMRLRTGVPVAVGRRRAVAGHRMLQAHPEIDVIVSDDGLQHLALGRTVQIIVFDERGGGNRWLLPAGPLRETLPPAVPVGTMVLYNAAAASTPLPGHLAQRSLAGVVSLVDWWGGNAPSRALLERLRGRPLFAAAGVARPQRFFDMLCGEGLQITALPLPDHFEFRTLPWPASGAEVIVTEKDAVKLDPQRIGGVQIWVAALDFRTDPAFDAGLLRALPQPRKSAPRHGSPIA